MSLVYVSIVSTAATEAQRVAVGYRGRAGSPRVADRSVAAGLYANSSSESLLFSCGVF